MSRQRLFVGLLLLLLLVPLLAACSGDSSEDNKSSLHIVAGSENEALEPIIQQWANDNDANIQVTYKGSLDIMLDLEDGQTEYDAVWPANSIWLNLGDEQHRKVKHAESILRSPVVLGVKRSVAESLGWIGQDVYVDDILAAAEAGDINLMMTSATQSNSGASAYFAFLYAFAGNPNVITSGDLQNPEVSDKIKRILGAVDRSSGSSGWLKDLCVDQYDLCDAMVNYEAIIIEANQELTQTGQEPLYAIYPVDGLALADSPLGYFDNGVQEKEDLFLKLQTYLLSEPVQQQLLGLGRRTGLVGLAVENVNTNVFNPDWGIDIDRVIVPIKFPSEAVIREALDLYQTAFRKPSFTVYLLDFSGSMEGDGERELTRAMQTLLDQDLARQYLLQASPNDVTVVLPFDGIIRNESSYEDWTVYGNDASELRRLYQRIDRESAGGGTDIYRPVELALDIIYEIGIGNRFPAIILMTDGRSNEDLFSQLNSKYIASGRDVPVFAITFGDAATDQLDPIVEMSFGRLFDGKSDLVAAFRKAKGYN